MTDTTDFEEDFGGEDTKNLFNNDDGSAAASQSNDFSDDYIPDERSEFPDGIAPFGVDDTGKPIIPGNETEADKNNKNENTVELDENGNPIEKQKPSNQKNDEEVSDEELEKIASGIVDGKKPQLPEITVNSIATELGLKAETGKEITLEQINSEIKRLKEINTEEEDEIKEFKRYKIANPEATLQSFAEELISPASKLLNLGNEAVYAAYLKSKDPSMTDDAIRYEVELAVKDGTLEEKVKEPVSILQQRDLSHKSAINQKKQDKINEYNQTVLKNRQQMLSSLKEKPEVFEGMFKLKNSDIKAILESSASASVEQAIKDHRTYAEVAYFLKNRSEIIKVIKDNGFEDGKGMVIEKMANDKPNIPRRSSAPRDQFNITEDEWG